MSRSSITRPTNASGHHPHGGSERRQQETRRRPHALTSVRACSNALIRRRRARSTATAASRPWRMHAGTPSPRNAAPVTRMFGASSAESPFDALDQVEMAGLVLRERAHPPVHTDLDGVRPRCRWSPPAPRAAGDERVVVELGEAFVAEAGRSTRARSRASPSSRCAHLVDAHEQALISRPVRAGRDSRCRRARGARPNARTPSSRVRRTRRRSSRARWLSGARHARSALACSVRRQGDDDTIGVGVLDLDR